MSKPVKNLIASEYDNRFKGVTGAGNLDTGAVEAMLPRIRQHVSVPVGVGFGIRDAQTAKAISKVADAVVIGSRLIQRLPRSVMLQRCPPSP